MYDIYGAHMEANFHIYTNYPRHTCSLIHSMSHMSVERTAFTLIFRQVKRKQYHTATYDVNLLYFCNRDAILLGAVGIMWETLGKTIKFKPATKFVELFKPSTI